MGSVGQAAVAGKGHGGDRAKAAATGAAGQVAGGSNDSRQVKWWRQRGSGPDGGAVDKEVA